MKIGLKSPRNFENLLSPSDFQSLAKKSEWETKKESLNNLKNVQLVQNRIKLLQMENQKRLKRIQEVQKKAEMVKKIRVDQELSEKQKELFKWETQQALQQLKLKTESSKVKAEEDREFIRQSLKQFKKVEHKQIKDQSNINEGVTYNLITSQRQLQWVQNKTKKTFVKEKEDESQKKVDLFRRDQQMNFSQLHQNNKIKNLSDSVSHSQLLQVLEQEELTLLQRLQESQEAQVKANQELNNMFKSGSPKARINSSSSFGQSTGGKKQIFIRIPKKEDQTQ